VKDSPFSLKLIALKLLKYTHLSASINHGLEVAEESKFHRIRSKI
jgi:hypothetical protein